jgi:hypothetical protein
MDLLLHGRGFSGFPISGALLLLQRVRDEAHRVVIAYNRLLRKEGLLMQTNFFDKISPCSVEKYIFLCNNSRNRRFREFFGTKKPGSGSLKIFQA